MLVILFYFLIYECFCSQNQFFFSICKKNCCFASKIFYLFVLLFNIFWRAGVARRYVSTDGLFSYSTYTYFNKYKHVDLKHNFCIFFAYIYLNRLIFNIFLNDTIHMLSIYIFTKAYASTA